MDGLIKLYDIRTMKEFEVWRGHNSEVMKAASYILFFGIVLLRYAGVPRCNVCSIFVLFIHSCACELFLDLLYLLALTCVCFVSIIAAEMCSQLPWLWCSFMFFDHACLLIDLLDGLASGARKPDALGRVQRFSNLLGGRSEPGT